MTNEEAVRRYIAAHQAHDYDLADSFRHPEWTLEWPQTGERVRGVANDRKIMDNWPGGMPDGLEVNVAGAEDRWIMTPSWTFQRIVGNGDLWWADGSARYPDGSRWFLAATLELRERKMYRERWFFAPPLDAPDWRAEWVAKIDG